MADPTIQTFCCHNTNGTDTVIRLLQNINTNTYNTVCLFSSTLGILGSIYQILPRHEFSAQHRLLSFSAVRGRRIIVWLAVADLLASLGVFLRALLWINYKNIMPATDDRASVIFCAFTSALIQYFYTATWIWTLCYAIDMRFILAEKEAKCIYYHLVAWLLPALLTITGLSLLYLPDANCHTSSSLEKALFRVLPNYIATYLPITIVLIANPWLYYYSTKDMEKIITSTSGQFTSKERYTLDVIKLKLSVINLIFYICWVPNLVNGIILWILWFDLPDDLTITIWYIMAFINPLQALFNCFVYRRWNYGSERIVVPWRNVAEPNYIYTKSSHSHDESRQSAREEVYPLLQRAQSINGYKSESRTKQIFQK